ncbi:response regulator, partial [Methanoregula sp.]|uniref:response regulator n=1 Tax=Methanoregula sp. TaxID=2052170 RepID=UPI000CC6FAF6
MAAVLFVDDEQDLLELARCFLEIPGEFSIDIKTSAQEGMEALSAHPYDAIVCDYEMPGTNGVEFLKSVRLVFGDIPFIIFTGRGREQIVIDALNSGADFYIQKGGDPDALFMELRHVIGQAIALKQARNTLFEREQRYHDLQHANDLIQSVSPEGRFIYVNRKWRATLWYYAEEDPDLWSVDGIQEE